MRLQVILVAILFFSGTATALSVDIEIDEMAEVNAHFLRYQNSTSSIHEINLSAENKGSIGCEYRIKGIYRYRNSSFTRYSRPLRLWPSETGTAELFFLPENYTGEVDVSIYSDFCDKKVFVENITFRSESKNLVNGSIESRTVEADRNSARLKLPVDEGRLVPHKVPSYWKASSARINNGSATVKYDPPLFDSSQNLTYAVVTGDQIVKTKVRPVSSPTVWERLDHNLSHILGILLFYMTVLSTKLLYDRRS